MFDINKCPKDDDGNLLAQTRDGGMPVTLITANGREPEPLVGWMGNSYAPSSWLRDGSYHQSKGRSSFDLINIPEPKRSGEVSFVIDHAGTPWVIGYSIGSESTGRESTSPGVSPRVYENRLAVINAPWTEGEGLEGK